MTEVQCISDVNCEQCKIKAEMKRLADIKK